MSLGHITEKSNSQIEISEKLSGLLGENVTENTVLLYLEISSRCVCVWILF